MVKQYESRPLRLKSKKIKGVFYEDDLITLSSEEGKELYEKFWFGQQGTYKAAHRGKLFKLDLFESVYLMKKGVLEIENASREEVIRAAKRRFKFFEDMFMVYEDWREKGYVVKTGFKFGTHFRLYFPGASPVKKGKEWIHSKHVIHVFPRKHTQLISEWARAIRVAHSVRKTFILAMPGKKIKPKRKYLDFALYYRTKSELETPKNSAPRFLMYSLTEDEKIGGEKLAEALAVCEKYGLEMLASIADRESSVTHYLIKKITLENSRYDYFEIEWVQP